MTTINPNNTFSNNQELTDRTVELLNTTDLSSAQVAALLSSEFNIKLTRNAVIGFANRNAKLINRRTKLKNQHPNVVRTPKKMTEAMQQKFSQRKPLFNEPFKTKFNIRSNMREDTGGYHEPLPQLKRGVAKINLVIGGLDPYKEGCRWLDDNNCACGEKLYNRSYCKSHYERSVDRPRMARRA